MSKELRNQGRKFSQMISFILGEESLKRALRSSSNKIKPLSLIKQP